MIRTGRDFIESVRHERQVWINRERVNDVTTYPAFAPLNAVYNNFDFPGPLEFVKHAASLSDRVMAGKNKGKAA
jgi:hypothetical protein